MGERMVLNKYYPPDFDPEKLPKSKARPTNEMKVRMMLPMTVRCSTCGTFMYKGTKFNTRKEDVIGENYLGIQVFRFYYRCNHCANEFTMKTDPKAADYVLERGATRNVEHWREATVLTEAEKKKREEEEKGNAMKALENRTLDSKREMDIMAALDELRTINSKHSKVGIEQAIAALQKQAGEAGLEEEEFIDVSEFYALQKKALTKALPDGDSDGQDSEEDPFNASLLGPSSSTAAGRTAAGGMGSGTAQGPVRNGSAATSGGVTSASAGDGSGSGHGTAGVAAGSIPADPLAPSSSAAVAAAGPGSSKAAAAVAGSSSKAGGPTGAVKPSSTVAPLSTKIVVQVKRKAEPPPAAPGNQQEDEKSDCGDPLKKARVGEDDIKSGQETIAGLLGSYGSSSDSEQIE